MKKVNAKSILLAVPRWIFLVFIVIISVGPLVWIIMSSFKTNAQILSSAFSLPTNFSFRGYKAALEMSPILLFYLNSIIIAFFSTAGGVLIVAMAAYIIARVKFKGSRFIVLLLASSMLIPTSALFMPIYIIMTNVGLYNTRTGLIIVYAALGLPTSLFVLRSHFQNIPREIEEAAFMDGCGFFRSFFTIVLPIVKPGLATAAILQFLTSWNEFMFALILTNNQSVRTLPLALSYFTTQFSFNYTALFAALVIIIIPSIVIYVILQEQVTESLVTGSVKG